MVEEAKEKVALNTTSSNRIVAKFLGSVEPVALAQRMQRLLAVQGSLFLELGLGSGLLRAVGLQAPARHRQEQQQQQQQEGQGQFGRWKHPSHFLASS